VHAQRSLLERIPNEWNIPGIGEIVDAFLRSEAIELIADGVPQPGDGARSDLS
jgi:hypothetical protein